MLSRIGLSLRAALILSVVPFAAYAQNTDTSGFQAVSQPQALKRFPAIFGSASAIPSPTGTGYVGLTYSNPRAGISTNGADGDMAVGLNFGDPVNGVAVSVGMAVTGLEPFGDAGSFSINASRLVGTGERSATFVGASASSLLGWGGSANATEAYAAYVSHLTSIDSASGEIPVQLTVGYGNRIKFASNGSGNISEGLFWGAGFGLTPNLSASVSGTETQVNMGVGFTVPGAENWSVSTGVFDVMGDVDRRQFTFTVSYGFSNLFGG